MLYRITSLLAITLLGVLALTGSLRADEPTECEGRVSGVIRLQPTIYLHENETHLSCGIAGISTADNFIVIEFEEPFAQVITAIAASDESLAAQDVVCGVRGGVTFAKIKCSKPINQITGSATNIWLSIVGVPVVP